MYYLMVWMSRIDLRLHGDAPSSFFSAVVDGDAPDNQDWDKLMMEYEGSSNVLIADVDCVGSGKSKCEEVGVRGYPTIKYGDPDDLQDYKGGRSFNDLSTFAKGLGPSCGPSTPELCDAAKKKMLDEFMAMDSAKREAMIKENSGAFRSTEKDGDEGRSVQEKEDEMEKLESGFKTFVEGLQKQYQESSDKKDADVEAIKSSGLGLLKAVKLIESRGHVVLDVGKSVLEIKKGMDFKAKKPTEAPVAQFTDESLATTALADASELVSMLKGARITVESHVKPAGKGADAFWERMAENRATLIRDHLAAKMGDETGDIVAKGLQGPKSNNNVVVKLDLTPPEK
eukprot:g24437.t1